MISLQIARRYLFGKKSTNAINLITGISVLGIAIGTAALVLILSVFNGFEQLTRGFLDAYNPDIRIEPIRGKYFHLDSVPIKELNELDGIVSYSKVIEEVAHFEYNSRQQIGIIKGVDSAFVKVTNFQNAIRDGEAVVHADNDRYYAVVGTGVYNALNINLSSKVESLKISVPNRRKRGALDKDFKSNSMLVSGTFSIRNEKDNQYVLVDYALAAALLDLRNRVSAIEIQLENSDNARSLKPQLTDLFPPSSFRVLDRVEQDASVLKIMNIEKWSSYLIFSFSLILIIFNVIGCLWMIVLDKRKDLSVLQSFGATKEMIRHIFLFEGMLISILGFGIGFSLSLIFYFLQKTVGIIMVPEGYSITRYPIEMHASDVFVVLFTVLTLGIVASLPAAWKAAKVSAYVRIE